LISKSLFSGRKPVNPQKVLDDIEALSDSNSVQDTHGSFSSTVNSNDMQTQPATYTPYLYSNASSNTTVPTLQYTHPVYSSFPTCYRCYTIVYMNFTTCIKCNRHCCQQCVQTFFLSNTVFCEYCMIQEALSDNRK
jgi:hypothetical protein